MTREEAIIQIKELKLDKNYMVNGITPFDTALNMAISALEAEPSEDAISRQAAIKAITNTSGIRGDALKALYDLPSVKPQEPSDISNDGTLTVNVEDGRKISRVLVCGANHWGGLYYPDEQEPKTGHWIDTGSGQECSKCHEIQYGYDNYRFYCANCGAKMEERA